MYGLIIYKHCIARFLVQHCKQAITSDLHPLTSIRQIPRVHSTASDELMNLNHTCIWNHTQQTTYHASPNLFRCLATVQENLFTSDWGLHKFYTPYTMTDAWFSCPPKTGKCFRGKQFTGNAIRRQVNAVWRNTVYLLQIWNCKMTTRNKEGWRKEIGEAMARKRAAETQNKKKKYIWPILTLCLGSS